MLTQMVKNQTADLYSQPLSFFGVPVHALRLCDLLEIVERVYVTRRQVIILHHNLHSIYLYKTNLAVKDAYSIASWIYIDGLPIVWMGRATGLSLTTKHRITFLESFEIILSVAESRGWRVYYLGSTNSVLANGLSLLRERFPKLTISGRDGFFPKNERGSQEVIAEINQSNADILFVGMGMPTQEIWLSKYHSQLRVPAILTSGATLEYVTGDSYRPPAYLGALGLYGISRLISDPKRFWRRYLVEPFQLMKHCSSYEVRRRLRPEPTRAFRSMSSKALTPSKCQAESHKTVICMMNDNFHRSNGAGIAIRRICQSLTGVDFVVAGAGDWAPEELSWVPEGKYQRFHFKTRNPLRRASLHRQRPEQAECGPAHIDASSARIVLHASGTASKATVRRG
jgi:N-acetylglucosaminyldiphosphoundecaprenol N-acetyl-beta-D-mannosaminyltransferase